MTRDRVVVLLLMLTTLGGGGAVAVDVALPPPRGAGGQVDDPDAGLRNPAAPSAVDPLVPTAPTPFQPGVQNSPQATAPVATNAWTSPATQASSALVGRDLRNVNPASLGTGGTQGPIQIRLSVGTNVPLRYELYGAGQRHRYELSGDKKQHFPEDRVWGIRFHRGRSNEFASYRLIEGEYEFSWSDRGWELWLVKAGPGMPPPPPQKPSAAAESSAGGLAPPPLPE